MKKPIFFLFAGLLGARCCLAVGAGEGVAESPALSGFGDFWTANRGDPFRFGQVEIDLETRIGDRLDLSAAVAFDGEDFGLGNFTLDFPLVGREGHFFASEPILRSGIAAGQFDVPFGLDWQFFPAPERKLVSAPLVVERTHGLWNDCGVQGYLETARFEVVAYAVNGFGHELEGEVTETRVSLGSRVGIRPIYRPSGEGRLYPDLEVGSSGALFLTPDGQVEMVLVGMDGQFRLGRFSALGEYIYHRLGMAGGRESSNSGFYGQGVWEWERYFLVSRYGQFKEAGGTQARRLSLGAGWVVQEGCELRLEEQLNEGEKDLALLQLVVEF